MTELKRCARCGISRLIDDFYERKNRPSRASWCKDCYRRHLAVYRRQKEREYKDAVFRHYGESCRCCGEKERTFLTIDHIDGGGTAHRKKSKIRKIHQYLVKAGFPTGYRVLCMNCNWGTHIGKGVCPHQNDV